MAYEAYEVLEKVSLKIYLMMEIEACIEMARATEVQESEHEFVDFAAGLSACFERLFRAQYLRDLEDLLRAICAKEEKSEAWISQMIKAVITQMVCGNDGSGKLYCSMPRGEQRCSGYERKYRAAENRFPGSRPPRVTRSGKISSTGTVLICPIVSGTKSREKILDNSRVCSPYAIGTKPCADRKHTLVTSTEAVLGLSCVPECFRGTARPWLYAA